MDTLPDKNSKQSLMRRYQNIAQSAGIDPNHTSFAKIPAQQLSAKQHDARRLQAYATRLLRIVNAPAAGDFPLCLLVDAGGCVLSSYKNGRPLVNSSISGLSPGDIWGSAEIGPNAITIGLAEGLAIATVGTENYNQSLHQWAIYFAPILALFDSPPHSVSDQAGIALLLPLAQANTHYLSLACTLAHDLVLNLHTYQMANWLYTHIGQALLSVGTRYRESDETVIITYCDDNLFDMFQIEPRDLFLKPLDSFISPLPKNKEFWTILEQKRHVYNQNMVLHIQGKDVACILTACAVEQPGIEVSAFDFVITTAKQVSAQVALKIGNRAIRSFEDIIGTSQAFRHVVNKARLLGATSSNILLTGESGVGKDIFAQALHNASTRRDGPFIAVNCAAIPRDLMASELFGYDSGAFTGARRQGNIGKFELANGGTIFLDEIGELPLDLQSSLLRVVEQKQFMRLGSNKLIDVDVKIIAATNVDIPTMIRQSRFRADLYYRLSTMQLDIPPLRQRPDDIIPLAEHFISAVSQRIGRQDIMVLSPDAKQLLLELPFPGNARELQNLVERIVQLYSEAVIARHHILENISNWAIPTPSAVPTMPTLEKSPVDQNVEDDPQDSYPTEGNLLKKRKPLTREEILNALKKCNGNRTEAARYLGIARKTLYRNLERLEDS